MLGNLIQHSLSPAAGLVCPSTGWGPEEGPQEGPDEGEGGRWGGGAAAVDHDAVLRGAGEGRGEQPAGGGGAVRHEGQPVGEGREQAEFDRPWGGGLGQGSEKGQLWGWLDPPGQGGGDTTPPLKLAPPK